jgi:HAD superfamily hydrolase (TIGR01549 family)
MPMKVYRALSPIKVISFDLDDTLYDNRPIIANAIAAQQAFLANIDAWKQQPGDYWRYCREQYAKLHPEITYDVTRWRQQALLWGMQQLALDNAEQLAANAYKIFADARSNIEVSEQVLELLSNLRKHYKVIAITNGNADVAKFNLRNSFDLVLQAGPHGQAKPQSDMFHTAAQQLDVALHEILHVGDSLDSDIQGANNAGCQSVWLNNQTLVERYKGLPHIEIASIDALAVFARTQ